MIQPVLSGTIGVPGHHIVIGHIKIQETVLVIICPGGRSPPGLIRRTDPCTCCYIGKRGSVIVFEKNILVSVGQKQILPAVIIEISRRSP